LKIAVIILLILAPLQAFGASLLQETFDNTGLPGAAYSTFDPSIFDSVVRVGASGYSVRWSWEATEEEPTGVSTASRWSLSQSTDDLYLSFYWRLNSDWQGSGWSFHPHLIYITDELWTNLSGGTLRVYVELTGATMRMVVGRGETTSWHETTANLSLSTWHRVECWFKMNTVGQANGEMKMWVDGISAYDSSSVTYRTDAAVHFAAVSLGPWMSNNNIGPDYGQTMWMDSLEMHDSMPIVTTRKLNNVTGVRVTLH